MISISLCMIVRNEEKVLARCLSSFAPLVDEIIIVDTGSNDQTKTIARQFTDKIYDFEWTNQFCDARNYSFSKASMDYIYCADADEFIDSENQQLFEHLKVAMHPEIEIVQMLYRNSSSFNPQYNYKEELRPKLYKRLRTFVWEFPIHEQVRLTPILFDSDIVIHHHPQGLHCERDFKCFLSLFENQKYMDKRLLTMYAKELYFVGSDQNFVDSEAIFLSLFNDSENDPELLELGFCVLCRSYLIQNRTTCFMKYAMKSVAGLGCSEVCTLLGDYYFSLNDYEESSLWYYNALTQTNSILNIDYEGKLPLLGLEKVALKMGNLEKAAEFRQEYLSRYSTASPK